MEPRLKLWVEWDGRLILSDYRVDLLMLVRQTGSLRQAAIQMGLSYRRAWGKVKELEQALGIPLLDSVCGGSGGGSSRLTPAAEDLVRRYQVFRAAATKAVEREFMAAFGADNAGLHGALSGTAGAPVGIKSAVG
jgi:molybdate transport system regulatory protein